MSLNNVKEIELINQIRQNGNHEAFREVFHAYKEMVSRLCFRFLGPDRDIKDVIQKVFIELFNSFGRFEQKSGLKTWVYRITANTCYKEIRHKSILRKFFERNQVSMELATDSTAFSNPESTLHERELRDSLQKALGHLTPEKRLVVILHDIECCTHEDIAKITGESIGTVKSRLFHARKELAGRLKRMDREL